MIGARDTIHAVAFQHGDHWVAQCLDYDIATQAGSLNDLVYEVERIIVAHLLLAKKDEDPFADIPKAPQRFWEMYQHASTRLTPVQPADLPIPPDQRPSLELRAA